MSSRPTTLRRGRDRRIAGVCCGLAAAGGIDPWLVRVGFILLAVAGGVGIPLYAVLAVVMPDPDAEPDAPLRWDLHLADARRPVGAAMLLAGVLLLLRQLGLDIPYGAVWGVSLGVGGIALGLSRAWPSRPALRSGGGLGALVRGDDAAVRLLLGAGLVVAGLATLVATGDGFGVLRQVLIGAFVTVGGLGLILYPWMRGVMVDLREERRQRIRSEERAEMAAHLHDSVLQTLALIQRNADRPRELVALARRQERELRAWLNSDGEAARAATMGDALVAIAAEVEASHGIAVEVVDVGDCPVDEGVEALVHAAKEAMVNAAKHAGVDTVQVYAEVEGGRAQVFVRDRGVGFERARVPGDRRGISQSIEQRMARHGGTATVTSEPGAGTEVALEVPIADPVR